MRKRKQHVLVVVVAMRKTLQKLMQKLLLLLLMMMIRIRILVLWVPPQKNHQRLSMLPTWSMFPSSLRPALTPSGIPVAVASRESSSCVCDGLCMMLYSRYCTLYRWIFTV
jgi:hypothetical protein